jgi:serine kinase of HPr protein (carbohydrate metabolism regulator)
MTTENSMIRNEVVFRAIDIPMTNVTIPALVVTTDLKPEESLFFINSPSKEPIMTVRQFTNVGNTKKLLFPKVLCLKH